MKTTLHSLHNDSPGLSQGVRETGKRRPSVSALPSIAAVALFSIPVSSHANDSDPDTTLSLEASVQELLEHGGEAAITYSEWLEYYEADGRLGGVADSAPGDDVGNILRFLTGSDPTEPVDRRVRARIADSDDDRIALKHLIAPQAAGVELTMEVADESMDFQEVDFEKVITGKYEAQWPEEWDQGVFEFKLTEQGNPSGDARFGRLRAELTPGPIPVRAHRMAAQLLEEQRLEPENTRWAQGARIGDEVVPFYRPDVDGVAYYEFEVIANNTPVGFIMVGTGRHDHTIVHWRPVGMKPSDVLRSEADDAEPVRFYRLDAGAYAAEDATGNQVAYLGNPLQIIDPMKPEWADMEEDIIKTYTNNATPLDGDDQVGRYEPEITTVGEDLEYEVFEWPSWERLKGEFAKTYEVLLGVLREEAAEEWDVERAIAQHGEGLLPGRNYPVAVLHELQSASLSGGSDQYVGLTVVERPNNLPLIELRVFAGPPGETFPFQLNITYQNGLTETLDFFVVGDGVLNKQTTSDDISQQVGPLSTGDWSSWESWWTRYPRNQIGSQAQQPVYQQFPYTECQIPPNLGGGIHLGPVGCGPVAWAMLFAWADNQAERGNPRWAGRWGIHRVDNLVHPAPDAVMPLKREEDVDPFDVHTVHWVVKDLHDRMGTRCFSGEGLTFRGEMFDAIGYLIPRTLTKLSIEYNKFFKSRTKYREMVEDEIVNNNTPAVIGYGKVPAHYAVAYAFAVRERVIQTPFGGITGTEYQRIINVNQGWGRTGVDWMPASVWFVGRIIP